MRYFAFAFPVVIVILLGACGRGLFVEKNESASGSGAHTSGPKKIFVTTDTYYGNLEASGGGATAGGITEADNICMTDAGYPGSGTYKALISDGAARVACTTANCGGGSGEHTNWILAANQEYRRADGTTVIGTTNSAGVFTFPLDNPIDGVSGYWTGFNADWTSSTDTCLQFTSDGGGDFGAYGLGTDVDSDAIADTGGSASCMLHFYIVCVEQ